MPPLRDPPCEQDGAVKPMSPDEPWNDVDDSKRRGTREDNLRPMASAVLRLITRKNSDGCTWFALDQEWNTRSGL
jgi:hypothetical protein